MNNILNIKRLGLVFRKDMMENSKIYLISSFILTVSLLLIFVLCSVDSLQSRSQQDNLYLNRSLLTFVVVAFFISGLIFASFMMDPIRDRVKRIRYLMTPSSSLEKFFSQWVIVTLGYIIMFFVSVYVADILRVAICTVFYPSQDVALIDFSKLINVGGVAEGVVRPSGYVFDEDDPVFVYLIAYFYFQSLFVLGATFSPKFSAVKTILSVCVIVPVYILSCYLTIKIFYGEGNFFINTLNYYLPEEKVTATVLVVVIPVVFTLFNWALAFFRFRETEIIEKL
jgi:hypothetical protein